MCGTLDEPTGLTEYENIQLDSASDYYTIEDGLHRYTGDSTPETET